MTISWATFRKALKIGNPKLILVPSSKTLGAMVYLRTFENPDADAKSGFLETLGIASPSFFRLGCPCEDVAVKSGEFPNIPEGKVRWVRGYAAFFRKLAKMHNDGRLIIDAKAVKAFLPSAFKRWNSQKFKDEIATANLEAKSEIRKKADWLKARSKPIPGYGMPLGWKPSKIITSGGVSSHSSPSGIYV